ncbi:hypothetical protein D3C81_2060430 [compost metagenome]
MMVFCGVFTAGVVGPNAAIELGQNTRSMPCWRASSSTFSSPVMFRFHAHCGAFSPVAESAAASR